MFSLSGIAVPASSISIMQALCYLPKCEDLKIRLDKQVGIVLAVALRLHRQVGVILAVAPLMATMSKLSVHFNCLLLV